MSSDLVKFNYEEDMLNDQAPEFTHDKIDYSVIDDNNRNNYTGGWVNFKSQSINGDTTTKWVDWAESYLAIPYTITVDIASDTNEYSFDTNKNFRYAVAPKPSIHFIEQTTVTFNGVPVTNNTPNQNFWVNEKLKNMNLDEYNVVGDLINLSWDSGDTINFENAEIGETNNEVIYKTSYISSDNDEPNTGHIERCKRNLDLRYGRNQSSITKIAKSRNLLNLNRQGGITDVTDATITYQNIAYIPLKYVSDFYAKLPSTQQMEQYELKVHSNLSSTRKYKVTYDAQGKPKKCEIISAEPGLTCPFMLSSIDILDDIGDIDVHGSRGGIAIQKADTANGTSSFSLTAKCQIGLVSGDLPCRIYLKTMNLFPGLADSIVSNPKATLYYRDFVIDSDTASMAVRGGQQVNKPLYNINRPRFLYIIPFLSSTQTPAFTNTAPFSSPLSSAPVTCSPFKLSQFNLKIGSNFIYTEGLNTPVQFYKDNAMSIYAHINGNSLKSKDFGTAINKTMWEQAGYGVYVFDLKNVVNDEADKFPKTLNVKYNVEADPTVIYDIYYVVEFDKVAEVNRATGVVTVLP